MSIGSFFGTVWHDIQIGVKLLLPLEPTLAVLPGGSIVVTVINVLAQLGKIIPDSLDPQRAALAASLTLPNHPTADPAKLEAAIAALLAAAAPIGGPTGHGMTAIATVEQLASTAPADAKKKTALAIMGEIKQAPQDPAIAGAPVDATVAALNSIAALV